ncbi:MAG: asparagine synthase (glutamine-hydrolyzing) [Proteobacteria bacterium]|nr:asparagine synthase (glutamine-hydrolyzing) [Pseudomonadota bacterium]MBU4287585.1 asparagine synthase (glutamine-hydrolyzing) [Pseudomonadota bacterium]MCG2831510.1 asparagine synthase (glutamine-hydrolyzing) [Desulfobacteraceae bacterium]
MCGICGIYNLDQQPVAMELIRRMNNTLVHRGPDDEGYYFNAGKRGGEEAGKLERGNVGLGHRRLSIIDLDSGKQPMGNEDGSVQVVFNGEIYNFLELRQQLQGRGHLFMTRSDTEVLVHGYEEWGVECVHRLRGMFAFAIWDEKERRLFLARDRLGIKPLYYYCDEQRIIFASELKAILEDRTILKDLDPEALSDYLSFGYVPGPKTIFKSIRKLPPGHILIQSAAGTKIKQYWDLKFQPKPYISIDEFCEQIMETLEESIQMRLISDVPLGAFLSGGIDSSVVVAIMSRLIQDPVVTNSVGFTKREYSELDHARATSKLFATDHHEYMVAPDAVDVVNKLSWHFDEPFADSSSIPTYYVSKMTRQNVTVALSGDGGDENFAGYRRYYFDRLENSIRSIFPVLFRQHIIGALAKIYPKADWLPRMFRAKTLLTNIAHDPVYGYFNSMSYFLPEMKDKVLNPEIKRCLMDYDSIEVFRRHYQNAGSDDPLSRAQYVDFKTYLVDDILTKVDRASMANSLEVRVPILDHKFVELVAQIPSNLKLNGKTSKYIFKKAASRLLPDSILNRKKMGFSIPVGEWLKKELRPLVHDTILSKKFEERSLFDTRYVHWLWKQHTSGMRDFTQPLWALLSFELWARKFL